MRNVTFLLCFICGSITASGQFLLNPSFESAPGFSVSPSGWDACGVYSTPDTQPINEPGGWNFTKAASNGNTYMGLVLRGSIGQVTDNNSEGAGTRFSQPLEKDKCYTVAVDLSIFSGAQYQVESTLVKYNNPGHLGVWVSNAPCEKAKFVWKSPLISNEDWKTFTFSFMPSQAYSHLIIQAMYADSTHTTFGNVLIDNFRIQTEILSLDSDRLICEGTPIELKVSSNTDKVLWWNNSTAKSITVSTKGSYHAKLQKGSCVFLDTVKITSVVPYKANLGRDTTLCDGDEYLLNVSTPEAIYSWNTGSISPQLLVASHGKYSVTVTNSCGSSTSEINISFKTGCCQLSLPDVFTPNNDSFNEVFEVRTDIPISHFDMKIFNRWGGLVYNTNELTNFWDGSEAATGVYFWITNIRCNIRNKSIEKSFRGHVSLIR